MGNLIELAERVEAATGPDRELDRAIIMTIMPGAVLDDEPGYDDPIVFHAGPLVGWKQALPAYTASIDAAITLVPEKFGFNLYQDPIGEMGKVHGAIAAIYANRASGGWIVKWAEAASAMAATPALAICASSLRARDGGEGL